MKRMTIAIALMLAFVAAQARDTIVRDGHGRIKYRIGECVGGKKSVRDGHGRLIEKVPCSVPATVGKK